MLDLNTLDAIEGILTSNRLNVQGNELRAMFKVLQAVEIEQQRLRGLARVSPAPAALQVAESPKTE